jgi:hypothetical protein
MATVVTLERKSDQAALRVLLAGDRLVVCVKHGGGLSRVLEHAAARMGTSRAEEWSLPVLQCFPDPPAAKEHLEILMRLRLREGYGVVETSSILDQEASRIADEIAAHEADPLSSLVRHRPERGILEVNFEEASVSPETCAEIVARAVRVAPSCLDYFRYDYVPGALLGEALDGKALRSVRSLIHTVAASDPRPAEQWPDDLAKVSVALPNLERLYANGSFALGRPSHPSLRELYLHGEPLSPANLAGLAEGTMPALSTLGLALGDGPGRSSPHAPRLDEAAACALQAVGAPRLREVVVTGLTDVTHFLVTLLRRPLPESWETVQLQGALGDEDELRAVLSQRAPALRSLGIPLSNHVSLRGVAEMMALLPCLVDTSDLPELLSEKCYEPW